MYNSDQYENGFIANAQYPPNKPRNSLATLSPIDSTNIFNDYNRANILIPDSSRLVIEEHENEVNMFTDGYDLEARSTGNLTGRNGRAKQSLYTKHANIKKSLNLHSNIGKVLVSPRNKTHRNASNKNSNKRSINFKNELGLSCSQIGIKTSMPGIVGGIVAKREQMEYSGVH